MGLPGAGKTALASALCDLLSAVHLNADEIRANVNKDLGFSRDDRIEHARRMGFLADTICKRGSVAVADFVCPTEATREAFGRDAFVVFVDRIQVGRFEDTNALFEPPTRYAVRVLCTGTPGMWARGIARELEGAAGEALQRRLA